MSWDFTVEKGHFQRKSGACRTGLQKDLQQLCLECDRQREIKKDFQKKKASRCLERHQPRQQSRKTQLLYGRNDQDSSLLRFCVHAEDYLPSRT